MIEKKYPASLENGGLNSDDADFAVGINQVIGGENVRWGSTDKGVTGVVESVGGTLQKSIGLPSLTFITIGSAEDVENSRIIFFKFCVTAPWHRITCYDRNTDIEYVVLLSTQVEGGLNFSKYSPIHSARVINGLLIWTDYQDTQHKINIDSAIKLNQPNYATNEIPYVLPIQKETISLIKRPPRLPLEVEQDTDIGVNTNFIGDNAFWFAYRYLYKDKETSVLSVYSQLIPYNAPDQTFNSVNITLPFAEKIDQDVVRVEVGVKVDLNPQFFGIKFWDKNNTADAAAIAAHNAGNTALSFTFYNNVAGEPWGDAYSVKPFESCPIRSKTLELARNRLVLGNNVSGYDTPTTTSLQLIVNTETDGATVVGNWYRFDWDDGFGTGSYYIIYIGGIGTNNGYYSLPFPWITSLPLPTTIDFNDYELAAVVQATIPGYFGLRPADLVRIVFTGSTANVTNAPTNITLINQIGYKTDAKYQYGIVFYDRYDRKCGVITNTNLIIETPDRDYDGQTYISSVSFSLSNNNAITEIPIYAYTYSIVRTKCLRTRQFIQARARSIKYAEKDSLTGEFTFTQDTYANTYAGIGIDIQSITNSGIGYIFEEGNNDQIKIYIDGDNTVYTLKIIAQQGSWVVCSLADLGGFASADAFFEIFRPYTQSANEPFYEVGEKYLILKPETDNRRYTALNDNIRGDIYLKEREEGADYLTENMNLNDRFWFNWFDDSGRINLITNQGQVVKPNSLQYSNSYILGSNINGLCEFEALNEKFVPYECGQIQKLQVTSKVQNEQGAVMLAVCQMQTASIYIGEVQIVGAVSNAVLAQTPEYIGTINVLKGNFGTLNPESVTEFRGNVFWVDVGNGKVIQYSSNGLFPISSYKMTRFWRLFSEQYMSMTPQQIEALGSRPYIFTTVDPHHNELLITIPKLLNTPPKGYLPDAYTVQPKDATGTVTITGLGEEGDVISVQVIDPNFGPVILGTYTLTGSEPFTGTIALNLYNNVVKNQYGYTATINNATITITAREGLGASINLQGRLSVIIVLAADLLQINNTDKLLINSADILQL